MKFNSTKLLLAFLLFPFLSMAQDMMVKGNIMDAEDASEPIIGATIIIVDSQKGTTTDVDGNFSLTVPKGSTISISYTGYETKEYVIENEDFINVQLETASALLEEVVVVGYGKQNKKVATGAISKISAKDLEGFAVPDVQSSLEGQVTGLIVNESSGQPGASKAILIRGISTNGDNSPLFVVDGMQVSGIDNISPGDIESIDVLKDAASCAIYGARGANGVVIITTKMGTNEVGGTITYEGFTSATTPTRLPQMLNAQDYIMITREKFANSNQLGSLETLGFPQAGASTPDTDWMDEIFGTAGINSHRLSATVKNAFVSLDYWNQDGVIGGAKSSYKRYSIRVNAKKEINDFITIGENISFNRVKNENIGVNNAFGSVLIDAFAYDPITAVYNPDKQFGFEQSQWVKKEYVNPLSRLEIAGGDGHGDQIVGNVYLEIKPFKSLRLRSDAGIDAGWYNYRNFTPDYRFHDAFFNVTNDVAMGYGFGQTLQLENYLNYNKTFQGVHNFDFVLGNSYRESENRFVNGSTSNIPDAVKFDTNWQYLSAGQDSTDLVNGAAGLKYALISYFTRVQYDYDQKYLFTGTIRRDGSSNFGDNNKFGIFPSFSLGWVASKEKFFNVPAISYLKIRGSWGINGSDRIPGLGFESTFENVFTYGFGNGDNRTLQTGAALATPPNPNLKWEQSDQIDIGLEVELFDGVWNLEADVYRKTTKDLLMSQIIPAYIGATNNPTSNLGEIRNQGIELGIRHRYKNNKLTVNTTLNYTHFTNEVINVAGESGFIPGWSWPVRNTPITRMTEGFPVGHFVGYLNDGIFQTQDEIFSHINSDGELLQPNAEPGDLRFNDFNGDGTIDSEDITNIGDPWPKHIFGLTLSANYRGFDISGVLSAQLGHDIFRAYERSDITFSNYQTFWLDRWTPENPNAQYPRLVSNDANNNQRPSDFYVEDGSFLRLRNLQLGYNLPKDLLEKIKVQQFRIYFSANNLFTSTNYTGFDPDIGTNGWILDTGIDKGFYPTVKTLGGGIKLTL